MKVIVETILAHSRPIEKQITTPSRKESSHANAKELRKERTLSCSHVKSENKW